MEGLSRPVIIFTRFLGRDREFLSRPRKRVAVLLFLGFILDDLGMRWHRLCEPDIPPDG